MSKDAERELGEWITKTAKKLFGIDLESKEEKEEHRRHELEAERAEREWRREERRRKHLERLWNREQTVKRHLLEKLGIKSLDEIENRIHKKQRIFVKAIEETLKQHKGNIETWMNGTFVDELHLNIPLSSSDGEEYLVKKSIPFRANDGRINFYKVIKEYDGEPLFPNFNGKELPLEFRKIAFKKLLQLHEERKDQYIRETDKFFCDRHLIVMKHIHKAPNITTAEISEEITKNSRPLSKESVKKYRTEIVSLAKLHFPKHPSLTVPKGNNKYIHANVVTEYWWNQGFCFETE